MVICGMRRGAAVRGAPMLIRSAIAFPQRLSGHELFHEVSGKRATKILRHGIIKMLVGCGGRVSVFFNT